MKNHPKAVSKIVFFIAVLAAAAFLIPNIMEAKAFSDELAAYNEAISADNPVPSEESSETQAPDPSTDVKDSGNLGFYLLIAGIAVVVIVLFFALRIPRAIGTLFSSGKKAPDPVQKPAQPFAVPAFDGREITATTAPAEAETTETDPAEEDIPAQTARWKVEKSVELTEGRSLISWEGEW